MPHSPEDKKKAIVRLRRIKGQVEALERAVEAGTDCSLLLQQISALRGAAGGLMAEVLESHMRETFAGATDDGEAGWMDPEMENVMRILKTYLK